MQTFYYIGLMSGTSLDGVDIAFVEFKEQENKVLNYKIISADTYSYSNDWKNILSSLTQSNALTFCIVDVDLAKLYADLINNFLSKHKIDKNIISAIGSHGHTIFHQVEKGISIQIGNGNTLSAYTNIPVVCDFRMKNVQYGGQGAPLVPIGDFDLFNKIADAFINIGGICNISYKENNKILAYDICPGNIPLNRISELLGKNFDKNGEIAKKGELNFFLLELLNSLPYYSLKSTKSLGIEYIENNFFPLIKPEFPPENNLRTIVEHIAIQISNVLNENKISSVMFSGGGTKNIFLLDRIKHYYKGKIIIPEENIIEYKEALIFAYLAHLRLKNNNNCLASVTGTNKDMSVGVVYYP